MPYCVLADILGVIPEAELIQLTDDMVPPVMVNAAVVDQAISQVDSLVNGYIGGRYKLPLVTIPELVKTLALDIAVYKIYLRRKKRAPLEGIKAAYDDAMKLLRDIQSGKITLGADAAGTTTVATSSGVISTTPARRFSDDNLRGF